MGLFVGVGCREVLRRLLDGATVDLAERGSGSRGKSAYAQVRVVGFLENGRHAFFGAEMDRCDVGETTIARRILGKLARIYPSPKHRRADRDGIPVRLVDYRIDGFRESYRLVTNILDPNQAPALELARPYSER